ncbi:beta family protein [Leucobacter aridicollis]|uniref:beta family protein n=1 Tax=Leucobacter aridicollis TaxID=283878 RepID=UPI0021681723|nr:beta family protein [Leucobacter aridicollis]MCS3429047.1 hypothetical protein [Leucobacter aridicollis]
MSKQYRPFLLARAGELAALGRIAATSQHAVAPVFRIPERAWDFETDSYTKTHSEHIGQFPTKIAKAWPRGRGFIDLSLLEDEDAIVQGMHPMTFLTKTAASTPNRLVPLISSESTPATIAAVAALQGASSPGAGILLQDEEWTSVNPKVLPKLMSAVGLNANSVDIFVDFGGLTGPVAQVAVIGELKSLQSLGAFRSVTIGGATFPDLAGLPRGITEFSRKEWSVYSAIQQKLASTEEVSPDYFDHAIQSVDLIEQSIDPRFLSFSAILRYSVADKWLVAKGELFKGKGGSGRGGQALIPPLNSLIAHPEFATTLRSLTDDWINNVLAGTAKAGGPQQWREWGTVRHIQVTEKELSTLT